LDKNKKDLIQKVEKFEEEKEEVIRTTADQQEIK